VPPTIVGPGAHAAKEIGEIKYPEEYEEKRKGGESEYIGSVTNQHS
jgi:hypothetical protein